MAEHTYTCGEEYHTVWFTTEEKFDDVVVCSYVKDEDSLAIYGYTMESDGAVCSDAKWQISLLILFLLLITVGVFELKRKKRSAWLVLTVLGGAASLPFLSGYLSEGHDIAFHIGRIYSIGRALSQGQIPQRITMTMGGNSIIPIMYPEILLYAAGFMCASGATVFLAYQTTCALITFATVYLSYYAAHQVTTSKQSILFTFIYVLNPFRLNELFIRAAVGEAFAMAFLPLVGVGMWKVFCMDGKEQRRQGMLDLVVGYSGLLSTHIILSVISAFFCLLFVIVKFVVHPGKFIQNIQRLFWAGISACVVVLLNLWFLVPFLQYFSWDTAISSSNFQDWIQSTSLYLWQIFMGETGYGINNMTTATQGEMSLSVGISALLCMLLFLGMVISDSFKSIDLRVSKAPVQIDTKHYLTWDETVAGIFALLFSCCAIFMSTSYFPWNWVNEHFSIFAETIGSIQYAWRLLSVAIPFLCALMTLVITALFRRNEKYLNILAGMILLLCFSSGVKAGTDYFTTTDDVYMYDHFDNHLSYNYDYVLESAVQDDYKSWISSNRGPQAADDDKKDQVVITGYTSEGTGYSFTFENSSGEDVTITVPVFWYGLHTAYLAGEEDIVLSCVMNESLQFTDVMVPGTAAEGTVYLQYEEPRLYRIAEWISLISFFVFLLWVMWDFYDEKRQKTVLADAKSV